MKNHCFSIRLVAFSTFFIFLSCTVFAQGSLSGKATFYSKGATGARTANGERLHHDSMTCAHRTLPFGTLLKVKNPANGKEVVVRVTDRGPFIKGRVIDLSWGAAKKLGIISQGVAFVEIENIGKTGRQIRVPFREAEKEEKKEEEEEVDFPDFEFELATTGYSFINEWMETIMQEGKEAAQDHGCSGKKEFFGCSPVEDRRTPEEEGRCQFLAINIRPFQEREGLTLFLLHRSDIKLTDLRNCPVALKD